MSTISASHNLSFFDKKLFQAGKVLDHIEQGFNIFGNIPVVAIASGALRAAYGGAEIVSAIALGLFFSGASGLCFNEKHAAGLRDLASFSFRLIEHGMLNIYRGLAAEALATGFLVIGAFALWHINIDSTHGLFMPEFSNTEIIEDVMDERGEVENPRWHSPIRATAERLYDEALFNLRL